MQKPLCATQCTCPCPLQTRCNPSGQTECMPTEDCLGEAIEGQLHRRAYCVRSEEVLSQLGSHSMLSCHCCCPHLA